MTALVCCVAIVMSLAGCLGGAPRHNGREKDSGNKIEGGQTDPTVMTDPSADPSSDPTTSPSTNPTGNVSTADDLTYPDHVATYSEVHPDHAPGNISGDAASKQLYEACGYFPDLGNAARCSRNLLGIKCLNGIDYRKAGLVSLELFCYSFESRLSADEDIALYLKSGCAHSDLGR